jgi:hypothetical protein
VESTDLKWRKASFSSNGGGECIEVGEARRAVLVRDTKERAGAVLRFSPDAWQRFVDRVKRSLADPQARASSVSGSNPGSVVHLRSGPAIRCKTRGSQASAHAAGYI